MARMRRIWLGFTASVFASVLLLSMIAVPVANAAYGIGAWVGYFSGTDWSGSSSTRFGTKVIQEGMQTDSIDSFVDTVRAYLGGSDQQRVGASFIVCTMLGYYSRSGCDITPSESQINDWDVRVRQYAAAGLIDWNISVPYSVNTIAPCVYVSRHCGSLRRDVVWYENSEVVAPAIQFRNPNGTTAYIIKRECANPLGGIVGLPPLPVEFSLTPSITNTSSGVVEPGSLLVVKPVVDNAGPATAAGTDWSLTSFQVSPGYAVPVTSYTDTDKTACAFFGSLAGVSECGSAEFINGDTAMGRYDFPAYPFPFGSRTTEIGDLAAGTKMCYALSVRPRAHNSAQQARHAAPTCVTVGKRPKTQIWGGDLSAGKQFVGATLTSYVKTSTSIKQSEATKYVFGSWIEYGIFATGQITGAGSGSAYAGTGLADTSFCKASLLSFTLFTGKTSCVDGDAIGSYKTTRSIPDVAASFPGGTALTAPGGVVPNSLIPAATSGTYIGTYGGDIRLNPSNLAPGKSIILKVGGTVTIAGNQSYDSDNKGAKYTSAAQLPQLVIIANKIIIEDAVTNVDAWLIANGTDGTITTCSSAPPLTLKVCDKQLTVNGPVMAKKLVLLRTAGSGTGLASGDPAEVFNLRPDAYLWASLRATGTGRIQTVYTTELPPRL